MYGAHLDVYGSRWSQPPAQPVLGPSCSSSPAIPCQPAGFGTKEGKSHTGVSIDLRSGRLFVGHASADTAWPEHLRRLSVFPFPHSSLSPPSSRRLRRGVCQPRVAFYRLFSSSCSSWVGDLASRLADPPLVPDRKLALCTHLPSRCRRVADIPIVLVCVDVVSID